MSLDLDLDPNQTALVLIDLQRGILARDLKPYNSAQVTGRAAKLAEAVRNAGGAVIYVHVLMNEAIGERADNPRPSAAMATPPEGMEIVPEAGYDPARDKLVFRRQWDAFYATDLDQLLRRAHVKTLILAGVATNFGVESTARSAQARGYDLVFAEEATSSMSAEMHHFSFEQIFPIMGRVRCVDEILASLSQR